MPRRSGLVVTLVVGAWGAAACGDRGAAVDAAPSDGEALSDAGRRDGATPLTWVDFTVSGCSVFDPGMEGTGPTCRGPAPLRLRFAPLAPAPVDRYLWELGDGAASTEATPEHTYPVAGAYSVTLSAGGEGGTAQARKDMLVRVEAAAIGAICEDTACADGLECICGGDAGCPASLQDGLCARDCGGGSESCGAGVCADLAPGGPAGTGWRRPLCLRS